MGNRLWVPLINSVTNIIIVVEIGSNNLLAWNDQERVEGWERNEVSDTMASIAKF